MGEWEHVPLKALCEAVDYGVTAKASYESDGPLFLRITDIVPTRIEWSAVPRCALDRSRSERYELRVGDLVVARTGATVGYAKYLSHLPEPSVFASYLVRFRVGAADDPAFVGHVVQSGAYKEYVRNHAGGAAQPNANAQVLGGFPVPRPPHDIQRRIAAVLSAFDDLIEINERRIELLENLARSLYSDSFVRSRTRETSVDGDLDSEWCFAPLGRNTRILMGQSPPSESYNDFGEGLPFHQGVGTYGPLLPEHQRFCSALTVRTAEQGDVLCSVRAPVGRLNVADRPLVVGRGLAALRRHDGAQAFLLEQLRAHLGDEDSLGGGTIFKAVGKQEFAGLRVMEPSAETVARFEQAAGPMLASRVALTHQNRTLAATRDLLLPRLVTGRLGIDDIDLGDLLSALAAAA